MKRITIDEINKTDLYLGNISVISQYWSNESYSFLKAPRATHGLCLFVQDGAAYTIVNTDTNLTETIRASKGDLFYLPKGSKYSACFALDGNLPSDYLINFDMLDEEGDDIFISDNPLLLIKNTPRFIIDDFEKAIDIFYTHTKNVNSLKALLYTILSNVCEQHSLASIKKSTHSLIAPAVSYIENHITEDFSVPELAHLCNISEPYFRRLFKEYSGKSPIQYKNDIIIEKACRLLILQELSVQEISNLLNCCDSAYFCRLFKKKTGLTPKEYMNASVKD